ncbi:hypothetical protein [Anaerolinea thermophila]|uniref:hypothetical protein n=1 Tax=Anaerolinea thermophila TaxID=167964 RepID=UPI0026EBDB75|nr:hypothetical protein [Anaerolinea thermophila]
MSAKFSGNVLLAAFGALVVLHLLILLGVVPAGIVWGGQIGTSTERLFTLEIIALVLTLLFMGIVAVKMEYVRAGGFRKAANVGVWVIFAYLVLNTVGNLASGVSFENLIFAPVTVFLAVCAWRLAIEK